MFIHYRTKGIVLGKEDRGESNQMFFVYTQDFGKLKILGKAIRKLSSKLRAGIELFYFTELEFIQGKTQKTLTDAALIDNFKNLKKSLKKTAAAKAISIILEKTVKESEKDEKIWNLLSEAFELLNSVKPESSFTGIIQYYFLWNLLSSLGYKPELYCCVKCLKKLSPENIFFDSAQGGLICQDCQKKIESAKSIDADSVKLIRLFLKSDLEVLKKIKVKDLRIISEVSNNYFSQILESTK